MAQHAGFAFGANAKHRPDVFWADLPASATYLPGEPVGLTKSTGAIKEFSADGQLTAAGGLLGITAFGAKTDANGIQVANPPATVDASAIPIYPLPGIGNGIPTDGNKKTKMMVFAASPDNEFTCLFASSAGGGVVGSNIILGYECGIKISVGGAGTRAYGLWVVDEQVAVKPFVITWVDELDPSWGLACEDIAAGRWIRVRVRAKPAFQHLYAGGLGY